MISDAIKKELIEKHEMNLNLWRAFVKRNFHDIEQIPRKDDWCIVVNIFEDSFEEGPYVVAFAQFKERNDDTNKMIWLSESGEPITSYDFRDQMNNCWNHSTNISHWIDAVSLNGLLFQFITFSKIGY